MGGSLHHLGQGVAGFEDPGRGCRENRLQEAGGPFTDIVVGDTGAVERVWTTFGSASWSEQIDLDVGAPSTRELFASVLQYFAARGVKGARLDAVGYAIKKRCTGCFFVEPEIFEFLDWFKDKAAPFGIELIPELHSSYRDNEALISRGYRTYDFVLPGLLLHSFYSGSAIRLREYLRNRSGLYYTVLDCHDGIPIQPDLTGILSAQEMKRIVETCLARGANLSRLVNGGGVEGLDVHQINITYYDALGRDDESFLPRGAVQLFSPASPQIYYVGRSRKRSAAVS
jgi:sucrose phosphorylase